MLTLEQPPQKAVAVRPMDPLFELQLRVARRADELARGERSPPCSDLELWTAAEREILAAQPVASS
jgi:hypothetical protein